MPISATMLDSSDLILDYIEDNFYDDTKPRRKESKFLKYLITETLTKRKNDDIDDEEIEEIPDDDDNSTNNEILTSTMTTLAPLATKQLKRRKTIGSQPYFYTYPTIPLLSIRNMRPKSSGSNPIQVSIPVIPIVKKKKLVTSPMPTTSTLYPVISERQQLNAIKIASTKKIEEESSDGGFDDMKLSDLINSEPTSLSQNSNVVDTSFAERIVECLRDLGGKATGAEISNWISDRYDDVAPTKKKLGYTINAVLSSKKHANLFYKDTVIIDGNKRALWCLIDGEGAKMRRRKSDKLSENEEQILDENSMESNGFKDMMLLDDEEEEENMYNAVGSSSSSSLIEKKSRSPSPVIADSTTTSTTDSNITPLKSHLSLLEDDNTPIVDILKHSLLDDEKGIGKIEGLQEPYRAADSTLAPLEEIKEEEKKTPLSRRRSIKMEDWIPGEKELKDGENISDISPSESDASIDEEEEDIDIIDIVDNKKKKKINIKKTKKAGKRKVGRPKKKGEADDLEEEEEEEEEEDSFEDIEEDEEEEEEEEAEMEDEDMLGQKKKQRKKRKSSVSGVSSVSNVVGVKKEEGESENDTKYEEPDELEGSTYTEMIAHALRSLGGRGTGLEITTFIDENYSGILHNKTVTWRNSVMGCLSANRRNLFSKEPVKQYAKRYVWVLNEDKSTHKKRKSVENEFPPTTETLPAINGTEVEFDTIDNYQDFFAQDMSEQQQPQQQAEEQEVVVVEEEEAEEEEKQQQEKEENDDENEENEEENEEEEEETKKGKNNKKINENRCDNAVDLITEALKEMGGKATGVQITDWLAVNYKQLGTDKKKLGYTVNAVLSSKKYKGKFVKDKMVQGGSRALWKLAGSPKDKQRKN